MPLLYHGDVDANIATGQRTNQQAFMTAVHQAAILELAHCCNLRSHAVAAAVSAPYMAYHVRYKDSVTILWS